MMDAVIFDVDGTLIDSVGLHAASWRDAFAKFGHDIPVDDIRTQIGKGGEDLMSAFLSDSEMKRIGEDLSAVRKEILKSQYMPQMRPFPGVRALFERILATGARIALGSSAKGDELDQYKRLAQIDDLLHAETSSDDADRSKPHPDIFQAALERLGSVDPKRVIAVGDTPYDAIAAARAGLRTIGVLCGGWSEAELRKAGCIRCYRDPADLLANFDTSPLA